MRRGARLDCHILACAELRTGTATASAAPTNQHTESGSQLQRGSFASKKQPAACPTQLRTGVGSGPPFWPEVSTSTQRTCPALAFVLHDTVQNKERTGENGAATGGIYWCEAVIPRRLFWLCPL